MKEIKPISEAAIEEAYGSPYAEGDIENVAFIQANTDRAIMNENIQEALSANNSKWREKINQEKRYHDMNAECFRVGGLDTDEDVNKLELEEAISNVLESLLSQTEGE